jgi:hypothetical protein
LRHNDTPLRLQRAAAAQSVGEQTLLLELLFFAYYDKASCDALQFVKLTRLFIR